MEDYPLQTAFGTPVNICFVSDEGYAEPLRTALYSLLCNRDKMRLYDILILYENFSDEAKQRTLRLAEGEEPLRRCGLQGPALAAEIGRAPRVGVGQRNDL